MIANGTVQISWNRPPVICSARNISYDINLIPTDGNSIDGGIRVPVFTEETSVMFELTPGREYRALLIARNPDCSISSCTIQKVFIATQNPNPGNRNNNHQAS